MNIRMETERFIMRDIMESDVEAMFMLGSNDEVNTYLDEKPIENLEESLKIIRSIHAQYAKNGIGRSAVIDKKTNDFLGWSGLKFEEYVRDDFDYYDLGYRFLPQYWGKGVATECGIASLRYGFEELGLKEIGAGAHVDNIGSNKVLQKVGMKKIETIDIEGEPHHWYTITKEEWEEQQK